MSGITYKESGVDIQAGEESVRRIKSLVKQTFRPEVLTDIGLFGGLFRADFKDYRKPVLVSSVDGVGTKLKVAFAMNRHDTIGEDLVNHCVNDILTSGAKPLFFLDYISLGKVDPDMVTKIVSGFARGCKHSNCSLIGGETAEMSDLYRPGEYDLAGTIVGIVDEDKIISGKDIRKGDVLIGLASNGLHTNGYTLARRVLFDHAGLKADSFIGELNQTIGEALLAVHKCYLNLVSPLIDRFEIKGIAHITGGGIVGNLSRIIPASLKIKIDWKSWLTPVIFRLIQKLGDVPEDDMRRAFNLGIGMILVVAPEKADSLRLAIENAGEMANVIGRIE